MRDAKQMQQKVLVALARGNKITEICKTLHVSKDTVQRLLAGIYTDLGVDNHGGAVAQAFLRKKITQKDVPVKKGVPVSGNDGLTLSEYEVIKGLASDKSITEIANDLRLSKSTVGSLAGTAYKKLGANGQPDGVAQAWLRNIISPTDIPLKTNSKRSGRYRDLDSVERRLLTLRAKSLTNREILAAMPQLKTEERVRSGLNEARVKLNAATIEIAVKIAKELNLLDAI